MRSLRRLPAYGAPLVAVVVATPVGAQTPLGWSVGLVGMSVRLERETPEVRQALDGFVFGGEGRIRLWKSELGVRYLRGSATQAAGDPSEQVVDAAFFVGSRPTDWLSFRAGPHLRRYPSVTGTARTVLWEGRIRLEGRLLGQTFRSYVEAWRAFSGSATLTSVLGSGQGIEGGMVLEIPRAHVLARAGYRVDRSSVPNPSEVSTLEALFIAVGIGRR